MPVIENILRIQLDRDVFHNEDQMVSGIAELAVDRGFDALTPRQRRVLEPFLTQQCSGITDPGGHHNNCAAVLTGEDLLEAYQHCDDPESLECEGCRDERAFHAHEWARIERE